MIKICETTRVLPYYRPMPLTSLPLIYVVLDGNNCRWSRKCIGLPSVLKVGGRLAIFCDAPGGESTSHMKRDVGLAWLELPLIVPVAGKGSAAGSSPLR